MTTKIPLLEQIDAVEYAADCAAHPLDTELRAALSTLKWVERHQAELRVLGEFPGATVVRMDEE
jgi:hypothetical protein